MEHLQTIPTWYMLKLAIIGSLVKFAECLHAYKFGMFFKCAFPNLKEASIIALFSFRENDCQWKIVTKLPFAQIGKL